ncbi:MAG: SurA N-terminal domain-containing protein [Holophagales bacterium]|nr:SurA N-terminal domain-containing protein [Holophagales bacterium]
MLALLAALSTVSTPCPPPTAGAQEPPRKAPHAPGQVAGEARIEPTVLVDRLVALVDEDPIFLSDLRRALALGFVADSADDDTGRRERRVLDRLIEERLRLHEVDRYDTAAIPDSEIERQFRRIEDDAGGAEGLDARLLALGLDREGLETLLRRQLRVLTYVEERLGARIFVDEEEVEAHYLGPLARELAARGEDPPPLEEVRPAIRALLREQELNLEVARWTDRLRQEADIVDLLDSLIERGRWPAVVLRLESQAEDDEEAGNEDGPLDDGPADVREPSGGGPA